MNLEDNGLMDVNWELLSSDLSGANGDICQITNIRVPPFNKNLLYVLSERRTTSQQGITVIGLGNWPITQSLPERDVRSIPTQLRSYVEGFFRKEVIKGARKDLDYVEFW